MRVSFAHFTIIFTQLLASASFAIGEGRNHFGAGIEAYSEANYTEALERFKAAEEELEGFAVNYNLGNTYYKMNRIPESILYYERALRYEPSNEDARYNLRLANDLIADRIESLPKTKFALWWEDVRYGIGPDGWAWLAVGFSTAAAVLLLIFMSAGSAGLRRFGFFAGIVSILLFMASISLAGSADTFRNGQQTGIIFVDKVDVKSEPRQQGTNVFVLHSGTKVALLRREGEWVHIEIGSGGKGWMLGNELREI